MAKAKRPTATVKLDRGRLTPLTAWDAEALADVPSGTEFDLVRLSPRSTRHNSKYWVQLALIVRATEKFPNADKMHEWVKLKLGYVSPVFGPDGHIVGMTVDSTAFDKMDQTAFNAFYERAALLILQEMGIDLADVTPGFAA